MDPISLASIKIKKNAYIKASKLVSIMEQFAYNRDEKSQKEMETYASLQGGLPLPSSRWGNAIALALEVNNYIAAKHLIENAEKLGLITSSVVSEFGGINPWGLKDEYLYSQLTNDGEYIVELCREYFKSDDEFEEYIDYINRNQEANKGIEVILGITEEEKAVLKK